MDSKVSDNGYFACLDGVAQIDERDHAASWMIGLEQCNPYNADIQIETSWDDVARGSSIAPCALVARRLDNHNFYRAELVENTDHTLDLFLMKTIDGVDTVLGVARAIGSYASRDGWFVRFRIAGDALMARAWMSANPQPSTWLVAAQDAAISSAGNVAVRSANSSSRARPIVKFSRFWVQTLGFTVHAWLRVDEPIFNGNGSERFVYWLGKGSTAKTNGRSVSTRKTLHSTPDGSRSTPGRRPVVLAPAPHTTPTCSGSWSLANGTSSSPSSIPATETICRRACGST